MLNQQLTPIAGSLLLSAAVASLPIVTVLLLLGVLRRPAWQASGAGLAVGLVLATTAWRMPVAMALNTVAAGAVFALWPVLWIVLAALLLYNIAVASGRFDAFRRWVEQQLPNDRRVVLVVMGFCFGALLEGVAGFGSPVAITSSLLIATGWAPLEAVTYTLIFNTAPVAFGALGVPITTLGKVTGLPAAQLGAIVGHQLPPIAVLLPFYVMWVFGGRRSVAALWPLLLVAGGSFATAQFLTSNYGDYQLTDLFASLGSLIVTIAFLRVWRPAPDPDFALARRSVAPSAAPAWQGWLPWLTVSVVVILWTHFAVPKLGAQEIHWPGLDNRVFITLYGKPYPLVYTWQPLASGTGVLTAAVLTGLMLRLPPGQFLLCLRQTLLQMRFAALTVCLILGLAYLMNYAGLTYTLGAAAASAGIFFALASPFLGWVAVMLSGSDTSGNALFGNLQVVAARQLHFNPALFAAANSSGGVMGKMVSPQNIATGVAVTDLKGREGEVFARTFKHSVALTVILASILAVQQFVLN